MKPRILLIIQIVCVIIAFCFAVFWVAGCRRYTSVGIDSDSQQGTYAIERYYRVRWTGDGSFWIGHGQYSFIPSANHGIMPFDWGGRFFKPPRIIAPRSVWNRIGFWRYGISPTPSTDPEKEPSESWIAMPDWLPVVIFLLPLLKKLPVSAPISENTQEKAAG